MKKSNKNALSSPPRDSGQNLTPKKRTKSMNKLTHDIKNKNLIPDLAQAKTYLDFIAGDSPLTFQWFADKKHAQLFPGHRTCDFDDISSQLIHYNQQGAGIYLMVNEGNGLGRKTANVVRVRSLFVDLDGEPLQTVTSQSLYPDMIIESSPGRYHCYWKVEGCSVEDFRYFQIELANKYNGDVKVHDLPRVMRIPGFYHQKKEPFMTKILEVGGRK